MTTPLLEEHRYAPGRLFLVAVLFVAAAPVFWRYVEIRQGSIAQAYENAALYQHVYPFSHYGFTRLHDGGLPLWNANQACGTPFLADPATGLFQPINALFLALPTERAMAAHAYVCLSLMGLGFVLFARALGVGYIAALVGGVAYAFCGAAAAAMSRPSLASAMAWAPLVFWGLREYARHWRLGGAVVTGLAMAMFLLSGAPAIVVAVLCLWVLYRAYLTLFPASPSAPPLPRRVAGLAVMVVVALVVSAVQWVPTLAWALSLQDPAAALWRLDLAGLTALNWRETLNQLLMASSETLPHTGYVGIVALVAVPAAAFHRGARRDVLFFLVAGALFLFIAGSGGEHMPLGFPSKAFIVPAALCLAVLTTLGVDRLLAPSREPHAPNVWVPALSVVILAGVLFCLGSPEVLGRLIGFLLVLLVFLVFRSRPVAVVCGFFITLLLFVDLTLASVNCYRHPFRDAPECYQPYASAVVAAQEQALGARVLVSAHPLNPAMPANLGMLFPVAVAGGGQIPLTKDQARLWGRLMAADETLPATLGDGLTPEALGSPLLDVMAVRAVLAAPGGPLHEGDWIETTPGWREVRTQSDARLVVNEEALPRAYYVPAWQAAESVDGALDAVSDPAFEPDRTCVVLADGPGFESLKALAPETVFMGTERIVPEHGTPICTLTEASHERVAIHVDASRPGVTVLADTFASGWRASLDGIRWPILRVNGVFRGIATPAGAHEIVFEYRPLSFLIGLAVSLGGLALLILLGLAALARR